MIASGIKDYLVAEGVGTYGTDLFVSKIPDSPDNCIILFDEPGVVLPENRDYDSDVFGTQIIVRGSYSYCESTMKTIHGKMPMMKGIYDSIKIIDTWTQTPPGWLENDDNGRRRYTAHYEHYCNLGNSKNRTGNYNP